MFRKKDGQSQLADESTPLLDTSSASTARPIMTRKASQRVSTIISTLQAATSLDEDSSSLRMSIRSQLSQSSPTLDLIASRLRYKLTFIAGTDANLELITFENTITSSTSPPWLEALCRDGDATYENELRRYTALSAFVAYQGQLQHYLRGLAGERVPVVRRAWAEYEQTQREVASSYQSFAHGTTRNSGRR